MKFYKSIHKVYKTHREVYKTYTVHTKCISIQIMHNMMWFSCCLAGLVFIHVLLGAASSPPLGQSVANCTLLEFLDVCIIQELIFITLATIVAYIMKLSTCCTIISCLHRALASDTNNNWPRERVIRRKEFTTTCIMIIFQFIHYFYFA